MAQGQWSQQDSRSHWKLALVPRPNRLLRSCLGKCEPADPAGQVLWEWGHWGDVEALVAGPAGQPLHLLPELAGAPAAEGLLGEQCLANWNI